MSNLRRTGAVVLRYSSLRYIGRTLFTRNTMAALVLLLATLSSVSAQTQPAGESRQLLTDAVFASSSFWYTKIPVDAPIHSQSREFVADFLRQKEAFHRRVSISLAAYSSPVYVVEKNAPMVAVKQWTCMKQFPQKDPKLEAQWAAVPIPEYADAADGTDAEMTVYQPSTDTIWEFWKVRKVDGRWQACWGGKMTAASKSDGRWHGPYGTTATGLPFLGGQITAEELQRGEIKHAMGISLPEAESRHIFSWPAKRSDGDNPGHEPHRIPEGIRFRLDPTIDVNTLKMRPAGKVIARAAQIYGFVVWDHAGAISLRAQNPNY